MPLPGLPAKGLSPQTHTADGNSSSFLLKGNVLANELNANIPPSDSLPTTTDVRPKQIALQHDQSDFFSPITGSEEYSSTSSGDSTPGFGRDMPSKCRCPTCLPYRLFADVGPCSGSSTCEYRSENGHHFHGGRSRLYCCQMFDCLYTICDVWKPPGIGLTTRRHVLSHFGKSGEYRCKERYCLSRNKTFRRPAELERHYAGAHCKNATKYHCHVLGCKYHDHLSFPRKDKLNDHIRNMQSGYVLPGRGLRKLKAKSKAIEQPGSKKVGGDA